MLRTASLVLNVRMAYATRFLWTVVSFDERLTTMSTAPAELGARQDRPDGRAGRIRGRAVPGDDDTKRVLDLAQGSCRRPRGSGSAHRDEKWTVDPERFHSSARNTPFGGWSSGRPSSRHHHRFETGLQPY